MKHRHSQSFFGPWLAALLLCSLASAGAHAGLGDAYQAIGKFELDIVQRATNMIQAPGSPVKEAANIMFYAMAISLFVWKAVGWALRGLDFADMVFTSAQIAICAGIMAVLPGAMPVMFNGAMYIGSALLAGIAGVPLSAGEGASVPTQIMEMMSAWSFEAECGGYEWLPGGCLVGNVGAVYATIFASLVSVVLGLAALVVDVWGFWGFAIAMSMGVVMVPFMLYQRLSFLFDGWVKFFFGFLVYCIIAKVNMALVAVDIMTYMKSTVGALLGGSAPPGAAVNVEGFADVLGLLMFVGVGIFTLGATGSFARAVVMGAGGGGVQFGAMARAASSFAAGAASAAATVGAAVQGGVSAAKSGDGVGGSVKAAAGAGFDKAVDTQQGNRAFRQGYAVGAEGMSYVMNGFARGLNFGTASTASAGAASTQAAAQDKAARDPEVTAALRQLDAEERARYDGQTFAQTSGAKGDQKLMREAMKELDDDERARYGGQTFAEFIGPEGDQKYLQEAERELAAEERARNGGQTFEETMKRTDGK